MFLSNTTVSHTDNDSYDLIIDNLESETTKILGNTSLSSVCVIDEPTRYGTTILLYNDTYYYTGNPFSLTYANGFIAGMNLIGIGSGDTEATIQKVNITNVLPSYLQYVYDSTYHIYKVENKMLSVTVNTDADYSISKSTNVTHDDTVTITFQLGSSSAYEILMENCTVTNADATLEVSTNTTVMTLTNIVGDVTVTVNKAAKPVTYQFLGNGATARIHDGDEYDPDGVMYAPFGSKIILLENPFEKTGYEFIGWSFNSDGTGTKLQPGIKVSLWYSSNVFYAIWQQDAAYNLGIFLNDYLHILTYTNSEGRCLGEEGYYVTAKRQLLTYEAHVINEFRTSDTYADARARYEKWAEYNGDTGYEYVDDFTHINPSNYNINVSKDKSSIVVSVISIVMLLGVSATAIFLYIKKKKAN